MSVPVADAKAEQAGQACVASSARTLVRCGCGAAIAVVVTVENCGRRQPPPEEAEAERVEADGRCREPVEEGQRAGDRREPSADPETVARVAALVAAALRREGPLNVRAIFKYVRVRRSYILDALDALEESGQAAPTHGPRGARVWKVAPGQGA